MKDKRNIIIVLLVIVSALFLIAINILIGFYKDYKCQTTSDIEWYLKNNCYIWNDK